MSASSNRYAIALLVGLLVVGLGIAASAFQTGTFTTGESDRPVATEPPDADGGAETSSFLLPVYVLVALSAVFGSAGAAAGYLYGDTTPLRMAAFGVGLAVLGTAFLMMVDVPGTMADAPGPSEGPTVSTVFDVFRPDGSQTGGEPGGASGDGGIDALPPALVLAGLAAVLLVGFFGVVRFSGGSPAPSDGQPAEVAQPDEGVRTEIGEAAGRAADRIGETELSNAVYRAWQEMTEAIDVTDPATTTPAEFADAAVAAGIEEDDVEGLTTLFREVRYGHAPPTAEREERAEETLERIEAAYAGEGPA